MFTLISCNSDDEQNVNTEEPEGQLIINLKIDFSEFVHSAYIVLYDEQGNELPNINNMVYQDVKDINFFIYKGNKFKLYCMDEGSFSYNYKLLNDDRTLQYEGYREAIGEDTLIRTYILQ